MSSTTSSREIAKEIRLLLKRIEPVARLLIVQCLSKAPDLTRLPRIGERLFGRERELALLDGAWADEETNIISLVAWGGVGKSAVVIRWLANMAREHFRGAAKVYGWSFYKQSMREEEASADEFFAEALRWFGEPKPRDFPADRTGAPLGRADPEGARPRDSGRPGAPAAFIDHWSVRVGSRTRRSPSWCVSSPGRTRGSA